MTFPNAEQRAIIEAQDGAHVVLAPAGSGKTQVMSARLALAIERGREPERLLCVTFTQRAAAEMRARIAAGAGPAATRAHVSTFHGLCASILRASARSLALPPDFAIYDEQDSIELLAALKAPDPKAFHFALAGAKSNATGDALALGRIPSLFAEAGREAERDLARRYHRHLAERGALDFADLIHQVRALLAHGGAAALRWERRFDWIQVDEMQDTHFSEYDVLGSLVRRHGNLALFGDVDQTIYEWRGSDPGSVLERLRRDFPGARTHVLTENHRATRALLAAADRVASGLASRTTALVPHPSLDAGEPVEVHRAASAADEARWIARTIETLQRRDPDRRIGVLTRTHQRSAAVSDALAAAGIAHLTVEEFEFFRRREVKDALARLRALLHPRDSGALRRLLQTPPAGITAQRLESLGREAVACGLRFGDFLDAATLRAGEPFARLEDAIASGRALGIDVETTGLDVAADEVVELATRRSGEAEGRSTLLRPTRPVGDSVAIHGLSDEMLAREGVDPRAAFEALARRIDGMHLVGHNVGFDLAIVAAHARRAGVALPLCDSTDTLELARRFVDAERHDLASLARHLGLAPRRAHRALDDVDTCLELLEWLRPRFREGAARRTALIARHASALVPIAEQLERWREAAHRERPAELLERVLDESGLRAFYRADRARSANLDDLVGFFVRRDRRTSSPRASLLELTQSAALAKNVDHLEAGDARIPVVTVHQAKGLEFDTVFVAGLCEGEFPSFHALQDRSPRRLEEERRLFYVAITRARRRLFVSGHRVAERGHVREVSRFLKGWD